MRLLQEHSIMKCNMATKGYIHSFQSLGAVDGPGIRYIVFMQGCPYRCPYCHNPDTREFIGGKVFYATDIADKAERYKTYFGSEGGVTVSGGEPLCQREFLTELFSELHKRGINTCIDTAGIKPDDKLRELLSHTDTVLCDIKYPEREKCLELFGVDLDNTLEFLHLCNEMGVKVIIRHVVVPSLTDREENILKIKELLKDIRYEMIELLPFKKLCHHKYEALGIPFPMKDTPECSKATIEKLKALI